MTPKNPSIILVRPQLPENIGMVARVMHNFGLKDLIIVSPRDKWLNNKSINAAKKATKIIKNIKVYDDLEIALSNFSYVVATTNRRRYLEKNSTNDFKFIKRKITVNKKTAILFGPENSGLSNEDLRLSDIIFTIETSSKSNSLNLSHAVTVLSHKLFELNNSKITNSISIEKFNEVGQALTKIPNHINAHKTVKRMLDNKQKQLSLGKNIDWATAEALAFGSLLTEGYPVRLSGQDCTRGTFSHRHSAVIDQLTEERYYPLNNISKNQKHYEVIDSMLSEYAVLGYEYGYSLAEPNSLTIWEAQFGDFSNGAQIMIDQFISSGEKKWLRMSGLVMLLPHGYEGQGPEHSSARLERFLQACAEDNWIIANCTTPSNYFHILRRQLYRSFRKPLVIMSPKSLLRNKRAVSSKEDFVNGSTFHRVLWDDAEKGNSITKLQKDSKIKRVIICSGKIYFDLLNEREQREISDIYLLRLEQFYPFPALSFIKELSRFKDAEFVWCQEEPKNQGGWSFVEPNLEWSLNRVKAKYKRARYIGRAAAASPATGLATQHKKQQEMIINEALTIN